MGPVDGTDFLKPVNRSLTVSFSCLKESKLVFETH